ncbi:MAG: SIR2 family protein [Devosia nanyangense]|uniref:SIR2 family protein n=1 Tax=Devosia nanyangense TaxID=1228055 RepID=A0A933P0C6_9HYPH|nr:SIR2 family protein [Devosia nanyangense]
MVDLPKHLLSSITGGRTVLFLGAGASHGAKNSQGREIPLGDTLAGRLASEFLGPEYSGLDFKTSYEYAASQRDVLTAQRFLYDQLYPFEPADFHRLIPELPWAGIVGTNYDLIIERAYDQANSPMQPLSVVRSDASGIDKAAASLTYIKLHGCITEYQVLHPPLVASSEQLINFREGRVGQFDTFLEWAKTRTIVFVGYSFRDPDLRALLDQVIKEGDGRPTHYIVTPGVLLAQRKYWSDRRIETIDSTFSEFLTSVDVAFPKPKRELALVVGSNNFQTPITRFISVAGRTESQELRAYLASSVEVVADLGAKPAIDSKQFYRGFDLGWAPIANNLDIRLPIVDEVLSEEVLPSASVSLPRMVVLKGHAGSGKSVAMRRICYEAAVRHERLCIFVSRLGLIEERYFDELFSLTNVPVHLFVDNASYHRNSLARLFEQARKRHWKLIVVCSESYNLWNTTCDNLNALVGNEYTMRYLSEGDIDRLLANLKRHDSLGYLATLPAEKQHEQLKEVHGRQILVALLEATHGVGLQQIVVDEYRSISPKEAQQLYLDICSLHRLGPPVRAGLISRVHNISFEEFEDKLFKPLEGVVKLRKDVRSGDFVFEARHSEIASVLYDLVLTDPNERFDSLVRILSKLNPAFSYDIEALSRLLRADTVRSTVPDEAKARQVYDVALESVGELPFIVHQRGVYEMQTANNLGRLDGAEQYLRRAHDLEPWNKNVQHSLAELDFKRSRLSTDPLEIVAWRRSAESQAGKLAANSVNSYPHHTLLKAALDEVRSALREVETAGDDPAVRHLSDSVTHAENTLKQALQKFPNDAMLLGEEGQLSEILSQATRAEKAFDRAFEANPRSSLIARRVFLMKKAKGDTDGATSVLRKALEHNPASRELNFDLALTLIESAPDGDQVHSDEVLYFLRRSFTPGDKQRQAQFWYARQQTIRDNFEEARPIFLSLSGAAIPFKEKSEMRGIVRTSSGSAKRYFGVVTSLQNTYGFVRADSPAFDAFFLAINLDQGLEDRLSVGRRVSFELGFTLRGPQARGLKEQ